MNNENTPSPYKDLPGNSIQDLFTIGYVYLLLLGIASNAIYYGLQGINIMSYTSILDVLLSPVKDLTESLVFPALIFISAFFGYYYLKWGKEMDAKRVARGRKPNKHLQVPLQRLWLSFTAVMIFSTYIGYGFGGGIAIKKRIENQAFSLNHQVTFVNGQQTKVYLIGVNSLYIFYVRKGSKYITVCPISGNVRSLEKIKKREVKS
ncbi:MAG: hypothetical protein HC913_10240 [Microscillaceae bacterium]|nr:hypothetical protein [Microscillaceae bacterium]